MTCSTGARSSAGRKFGCDESLEAMVAGIGTSAGRCGRGKGEEMEGEEVGGDSNTPTVH